MCVDVDVDVVLWLSMVLCFLVLVRCMVKFKINAHCFSVGFILGL